MPYVLVQQGEEYLTIFEAICCLDSEALYNEAQDVNSCKINMIQTKKK